MRILNVINLLTKKVNDAQPTKIEQDLAYQHVFRRNLERPNTSYLKFSAKLFLILLFGSFLGLLGYSYLALETRFTFLPKVLYDFYHTAPLVFKIIFILSNDCFILFIFSRQIIIEVILLYQSYADEDIRRRCLFKPTCSEYTIMSLNKYGVIIGLFLGYKRVFKKCRGNTYRIDYP